MAPRWIVPLDGSELPDRAVIGGKGWSVARMASLGLPVPPAFVIACAACTAFQETGLLPDGLEEELSEAMGWLEEQTGRRFGAGPKALLVSVRSGAPVSMPGMMDTVLNLGIVDATVAPLREEFGDGGFVEDTHRRFHELFAEVVLRCAPGDLAPEQSPADWRARISKAAGRAMPETCDAQLRDAVVAVFASWNGRRAKRYRRHHDIPDDLGTAVVVQAMVFGNLDDASGTGVMFTRNPVDGTPEPFGEFLARAQGEDVVSGRFTPQPLDAMRDLLPDAYAALLDAAQVLEEAGHDVQDIEFTVEGRRLYLLQVRPAKRAPAAALRIACDMLEEGRIDAATALGRISAAQVRSLLAPRLSDAVAEGATVLGRGSGASPGVGIGRVTLDSDDAERRAEAGEAVVLARVTTSPDDLHGMIAAQAVVTRTGGSTSHAAVVGRSLGVPCVVGCADLDLAAIEGRTVTVDGTRGAIYEGALDIEAPEAEGIAGLARMTREAEALSPIRVVAPEDAPEEVLDLLGVEGSEDVARLPKLLKGHRAAMGAALHADGGMAAAIEAGLDCVVGTPRLPLLLDAVAHAARET